MEPPAFINREAELALLRRHLDAPPALFVLYGRRRTGKTALLHQACTGRRHVYFTADLGSPRDHLRSFSRRLFEGLGEPELAEATSPGSC